MLTCNQVVFFITIASQGRPSSAVCGRLLGPTGYAKGEIMARGINKVILIGNLGADPETRYTQAGGAVTNVRLATSDSWRDKATGEQQERTEWHRVVFSGRLAEIAGQYLRKGSKAYVEGRLQTRSWEQDGVTRFSTEIVANEMQMMDSRGGGGGGDFAPPMDSAGGDPMRRPAQNSGGGGAPRQPAPQGAPAQARPPEPPMDDFDDDIPF